MHIFRVLSLVMVLIGTIIGAGFASGLEIWTFFGKFGIWGFLGIALCGIIITVISCGITLGASSKDFTSFDEFCTLVCGNLCGKFFCVLGTVFMFSAFCIMLSGSGAIFVQKLDYSYGAGIILMAVICFFTYIFGASGITFVNILLTPLMILGISVLGIYSLLWDCRNVAISYSDLTSAGGALISAIVYVSYNFLSLPPVILTSQKLILSKREAILCGILTGTILSLCGFFMYLASITPSFIKTSVPALTLASKISTNFGTFYGITVYFSMLTTAIGNLFGFVNSVTGFLSKTPPVLIAIFTCVSGALVAFLGFSTLVNTLYTVIGYAALLLTFLLLRYSLKKLKHLKVLRTTTTFRT